MPHRQQRQRAFPLVHQRRQQFASMEDALACYNSPEYTEARKIRQSVSDGEFLLVEGAE